MGLRPWEYCRFTWAQFQLQVEGHRRRLDRDMECAREISYMIYCANTEEGKRVDKYELYPLSIDPTPKQIQKARESQLKAEQKRDIALYESRRHLMNTSPIKKQETI